MYYFLNYIFTMFLMISIALVYTKEVSSTFVLVFLIIAAVASFLASAYAMSKYNALVDRIKKMENRKEKQTHNDEYL